MARRILVVEDEAPIADAVAARLRSEGFEVRTAGDGPSGGECMRLAFRPEWKNGHALYLPCDRESLVGHDAWLSQYPQLIWKPAKGISHYLEVVHDLLQGHDHVSAAA